MAPSTKRLAGGALIIALAVLTLVLYASYMRTSCARTEGGVVCVEQRVLLGGYPIAPATSIEGIRGVELDESCTYGSEGRSCSWFLELDTSAGPVRVGDSFNRPKGEAAHDAIESVLRGRSERAAFDNYNRVMVILGLMFVTGPMFALGALLLRSRARSLAKPPAPPAATTKQGAQPVQLPPPRAGD